MPRLQPQLFRSASRISPELATLLPACRDLQSAATELRWIREHVDAKFRLEQRPSRLAELCRRRGRGVPLQYVLGSQPFGSLDIKCRPGVLIPRPETEAYACHLVDLLKSGLLLDRLAVSSGVNIIDFCTGTGCIPLLLFSLLQRSLVSTLEVRGIDISPKALQLAQANISHNVRCGHMGAPNATQQLSFEKADVFSDADIQVLTSFNWDVMTSNPPYVSGDIWNHGRGQLGYSVRKYEPRLALVPGSHLPFAPAGLQPQDIFYSRLIDVASILKPKVLLLEVGDGDQARRVIGHCAGHALCMDSKLEVWRDWPDFEPNQEEERCIRVQSQSGQEQAVPVRGSGNIRSILITRTV